MKPRKKRRALPKKFSMGALARADRRALPVRYVVEGAQQILEDRGGAETASFLLQRAAHRTMHLDQKLAAVELDIAQGKPVDDSAYMKGAATWLRYAEAIGLMRVAKRSEKDELHGYIAAKDREAAGAS
jgi:hypothetical protein